MLRELVIIIPIVIACRAIDEKVAVLPVGRHTGIWALKFRPSSDKSYAQMAEDYAIEHDLINKGVVGELEDTYEFVMHSKHQGLLHKRELLEEYANNLMNDHVIWLEHQPVLKRTTRTIMFNDPKYQQQWHLVCVLCVYMYVYVLCVFVYVRVCGRVLVDKVSKKSFFQPVLLFFNMLFMFTKLVSCQWSCLYCVKH